MVLVYMAMEGQLLARFLLHYNLPQKRVFFIRISLVQKSKISNEKK
jgi:hypothetical protein